MTQFDTEAALDSSASLKDYLYLFWGWAWLIVLNGALAGGAAFYMSSRSTAIYEASTRLLVSEPPAQQSIQYTGMVSMQTMARTYAEILVDRPVLQGVIDQLGLPIAPEDLQENVSVELVRDTQVLVVTVQNPGPQQAADIANTIASVFAQRMRQLQSERYLATEQGLSTQVQDMETQIDVTSKQLAVESDASKQAQLEARLTEYRRLYANLVTNYEQVRLAEAQTSTNVVVSEPASASNKPVTPKTTRNTVLAAIAGLLLSAGAVLAVDMLDDSIKNPEEIRKKFGLPILGVIARHSSPDGKPLSQSQPRSPIAESFRGVRTNLMYAGIDQPLKRILVTSPTPQDGKTTVATNLAVVMAQGEKKTLLIDADLRRPQVHARFGLANHAGLSDLFVNPLDSMPMVLQTNGISGLALMSSGSMPPNPAELLTSKRMALILERLSQAYDMIVIDTPPVLAVTDALALAHSVDGVILVAKPGVTKLSAFRQTVEQMQAVNARILGVVLNEVEARNRKYGYYYSRYNSKYSTYYDNDGMQKNKNKTSSSAIKTSQNN